MNKKWTRCAVLLMLLFSLVLGQAATSFAAEGEANIIIASGNVYDVESGKDTKIRMQVKNKGAGTAENVYIQAKSANGIVPYKLSMEGNGNVGSLGVNGVAYITLNVKMEDVVDEPSYPITLEYTYATSGGESKSGSATIYLRIRGYNKEPQVVLEDVKLQPEVLIAGEKGVLSGKLFNRGTFVLHQAELSLVDLQTDGITLTQGFHSKQSAMLQIGNSMDFSFPLTAHEDMKTGNYPVNIKLKYKNEFGKEYERTQQYYIRVEDEDSDEEAYLEIRNMTEPSGRYEVGEEFSISFALHNTGKAEAENIKIEAVPAAESDVVPKSASVKTIQKLGVGEVSQQTFRFMGTKDASTQNYAIGFTVTYLAAEDEEKTFQQFAGVNVKNTEKDEEEEEEENTSKPKIIVSNYKCDPLIVMAGEEFDLHMTLMNTHRAKKVENIKMFLTLAEETSSDDEKSGNIFTPVNSSNTFYFDEIGTKKTVDKQLRLYVVPDAQPKTYTLTVNFEYEDSEGKEYTATELLGINVKQVTELQVDEFSIPESVEQYMPVSVAFQYYNTGKVTLNNLMIKVEGDVECQNRSTYIGNMESGYGEYFETSFTPTKMGEVPVSIVISYEDPSGEYIEQRKDFVLQVSEPMMEDFEEIEEMPAYDMKKIGMGVGAAAVIAAAAAVILKKRTAKKAEAHLQEDTAEEDDFEDTYEETMQTEKQEQ